MAKFTFDDIKKLVNEELERYSEKQALISERKELEAELKSLNEVAAGGEMSSDKDYHKGQKDAEFEMKGSHMVEEEEVEDEVTIEGGVVEEDLSEMENDFDNTVMEDEEVVPDMADPVWIKDGQVKEGDVEEGDIEEEVDMDSQIKEDLEEMMEPEMAEEITETISEETEEDGDEINPADYSGLGEGEEVAEDMAAGAGNDFAEGVEPAKDEVIFESSIDKRRKNIMSESTLSRMRVLSGQDKRWDKE